VLSHEPSCTGVLRRRLPDFRKRKRHSPQGRPPFQIRLGARHTKAALTHSLTVCDRARNSSLGIYSGVGDAIAELGSTAGEGVEEGTCAVGETAVPDICHFCIADYCIPCRLQNSFPVFLIGLASCCARNDEGRREGQSGARVVARGSSCS
jgi:hypothetical protein